MGAITDLWKSERGLVAIVLLAVVTAAMFTGSITSDQWLEQIQWISGVYIGSKTVTGGIAVLKGSQAPAAPAATPAPAPAPAPTPAGGAA